MEAAMQTMLIGREIEEYGAYEALRRMYETGCRCFEVSGHIDLNDQTIDEMKRAVHDFDLKVCALSVEYTGRVQRKSLFPGPRQLSLLNDFEGCVHIAKELGCDTLRFAGMPVASFTDEAAMHDYFAFTEALAVKLAAEGITLCAHNHESEFIRMNGKTVWEWSLELCPHLHYEMDLFGVQMAGMSPLDYLEKSAGRTDLLHYSDITVVMNDDPHDLNGMIRRVPLGLGNVNTAAVKHCAERTGVSYFIIEASESKEYSGYDVIKTALENYEKLV